MRKKKTNKRNRSFELTCDLNAERDVRGQTVEAGEGSVEDHENEALVVPVPDAVVDPNAVVVHAQHASIAALAVVRAQRLELQARLAPVERERFGAFRLVVLEEVEDVVPPPLVVRRRRAVRRHQRYTAHRTAIASASAVPAEGSDALVRRLGARITKERLGLRELVRENDPTHRLAAVAPRHRRAELRARVRHRRRPFPPPHGR